MNDTVLPGDRLEDIRLPTADLLVESVGNGSPVVVVHGEDGTVFLRPFVEELATRHTVHLVHLPGWGVTPGSDGVEGVDDLALVVSEYVESLGSAPVPVVGCSFGAWVVAQAAVFDLRAFSAMALVSPVGIKSTGREERSYMDIWATDPGELRRALYGDPARMPDLRDLDDSQFRRLAHANEAVARHGWQPYLYDPKLSRRLRRVRVPTLIVTGSDERFVLEPDSGAVWAGLVSGPGFHTIVDGVGHRVEEEAPVELARAVVEFFATNTTDEIASSATATTTAD